MEGSDMIKKHEISVREYDTYKSFGFTFDDVLIV
jgi:hypothetical protein